MPKKPQGCKKCGKPGHNALTCGREPKGHPHKKAEPKTATGGGKKSARPRAAKRGKRPTRETARPAGETPTAPVTHLLDGNGTRKKAEALLLDLRDLRTKLDVKIGHVEELVAIL